MSIWDYELLQKHFFYLNEKFSRSEGKTPVQKFELNNQTIFVKREDKNPFGSWKDRASALKVSILKNTNKNLGIIASSGNAALSYVNYFNEFFPEFKLHIILSPDVNKGKLDRLNIAIKGTKHEIIVDKNPLKHINKIKQLGGIDLRSSFDRDVEKAYWTLGIEISKLLTIKNGQNLETGIFIPVSSGTAIIGIVEGLMYSLENEYVLPRIYAVQTTYNYPLLLENISEITNSNIYTFPSLDQISKEDKTLADAIYNPRCIKGKKIIKIIKDTQGGIIVVSNNDLIEAKQFVNEKLRINENITYNSLVSLSGFLKSNLGLKSNIIIFSGY